MKKRIILSALTVAGLSLVNAQVGINTEDPKTTLHVVGTNDNGAVAATDGVLVPRVNALAVNGTEDGQLVYLIADAGTFDKGFHFWNATNSAWEPIADAEAIAASAEVTRIGNDNILSSKAGDDSTGTTVGTGSLNLVLGDGAGGGMESGSSNVFLGMNAGSSSPSPGDNNVYIGRTAGNLNRGNGGENVAVGWNSLNNTRSSDGTGNAGNQNIAVGVNAFQRTGIDNQNLAVGHFAGRDALLESNNMILGSLAAREANLKSNNIILGSGAAESATIENDNIVIGSKTAFNQTIGENNIVIGKELDLPISGATGATSDQLNIQNAIFGTGNDGTGSTVSSDGKIGIGQPAPQERLDVDGIAKSDNVRVDFEERSSSAAITKENSIIVSSANQSLPAPSSDYNGITISITNSGTSGITFNGAGTTVNGTTANTRVIPVGSTFKFTSNGSEWFITGQM